jgi:hypothetical protein
VVARRERGTDTGVHAAAQQDHGATPVAGWVRWHDRLAKHCDRFSLILCQSAAFYGEGGLRLYTGFRARAFSDVILPTGGEPQDPSSQTTCFLGPVPRVEKGISTL